ncbi:MAG: hypothetical protein AB8B49_10570 [Nitratireductor sp.]
MLRPFDILMIGLLLGGAALTYKIKHDSEMALDRVAKLEAKIKKEQELIDVLKADWALLTSPKRLESLVKQYRDELGLDILKSENIGSVEDVPEKLFTPKKVPSIGIADLIDPDRSIATGATQKETGAAQ